MRAGQHVASAAVTRLIDALEALTSSPHRASTNIDAIING